MSDGVTLNQLTKYRENFEEFLNARGAQILQPTNEWEMLRFRTDAGVSVIYCNKKDGLTFTGKSAEAWNAFRSSGSWRGAAGAKRIKQSAGVAGALVHRDGKNCFFCHLFMEPNDRTVEHLVPLTHGGPNHLSNYVLAHGSCNAGAGHLSAMEKIHVREANRGAA